MGEKLRRAAASALMFGRTERIERRPLDQRSRLQQARLDSGHWAQHNAWTFAAIAGVGPVLLGGIVGIASSQWLAGVGAVLVSLILIYGFALLVFAWQAPAKISDAALAQATSLKEQVRDLQERAPKLTLGEIELPKYSMRYLVGGDEESGFYLSGRVLLAPVTVSRGSGSAEAVRARLTFLPDDEDGQFSPRNPVFAEWAIDDGSLPTIVEIPSNGLPMHFCVGFVADDGHPAVFVWTQESRAMGLSPKAFGVASHPVEIHVEVSGSGHGDAAPFAEDTLQITWHNSMLNAKWASADPEENRPGVHRPQRRFMPRPGS
jgi:hypothetical protein